MDAFVNCHAHVFTKDCLPPRFLPFFLAPILSRLMRRRWLALFLMRLNPFTPKDLFSRISNMLVIASLPDQKAVFRRLQGCYPEGTRFVVLSMDMGYMGAGRPRKNYGAQLDELAEVRDEFPGACLPFVCADPRNPEMMDIVTDCIQNRGFRGIKIYPPYGFFPYDRRMDPLYDYAASQGIPVVTHSGPASFMYRGRLTRSVRTDPESGEVHPRRRKKLAELWVHPANYRLVLLRHPTLKLCLAHFGGLEEWQEYLSAPWNHGDRECWLSIVLDLIRAYPNVYTDVSYTVHKPEFHPLLKVLLQEERVRTRVLYGSDYYMTESGASERRYSVNLRGFLGEADFRQIAEANPAAFLG